jgi:ADP-ribose pyrophosphatase YjhB (NUDIX family)
MEHLDVLFQWHECKVTYVPRSVPAPAAVVRPVVIDRAEHRFLLSPVQLRCGDAWSVPTVPVRAGEPYRRTAVRYLRWETGLPCLRIAPVVGVLPAIGGRQLVEYVVLAGPVTEAWLEDVRVLFGTDARWWSTAQLRDTGVRVEPDTLPLLMDGYWEGWLPDGEVSLE